jgi:hypothetical protein
MPERTQLSQPDEALRQSAGLDGAVRRLLTETADYLSRARHMDRMAEASRIYLASAKGTTRHPMDSEAAAATTRALLEAMPTPYASETRGEYALRLRAVARAS